MSSDSTVSLEDHLSHALKPLLSILPPDISATLATELQDAAKSSLQAKQLDPRAYDNVVSLMAGTRTAPSSVPPPNQKSAEDLAHEESRRARNDKRALAMILNGSLSTVCAGVAGWWAADKSGWKDEWKVLLALTIATIVGVAETVLFIIWQSRANGPVSQGTKFRWPQRVIKLKKSEEDGEKPSAAVPPSAVPRRDDQEPNLRRRTARKPRN